MTQRLRKYESYRFPSTLTSGFRRAGRLMAKSSTGFKWVEIAEIVGIGHTIPRSVKNQCMLHLQE